MKFKDLYEDVPEDAKKKLFDRIRQFKPFLQKTNGMPWFRGVNDYSTVSSFEVIRKDRKPRTSTFAETNFFNLFAEHEFGVKHFRNNCLFAQKGAGKIGMYGRLNMIFLPEDSWLIASPKNRDMYEINPVGRFNKMVFDRNDKRIVAWDRCIKLMNDIEPLKFDKNEFLRDCKNAGIDESDVDQFLYEAYKFMKTLEFEKYDFENFGSLQHIPGNCELMISAERPYLRVDLSSFLSLYYSADEIGSFNLPKLYEAVEEILKKEVM
ncbi:hypothetical protein RsoM2USA_357 [Ralstonia phage RsoM2USA]|nr:hypothetical protein RsoM2USA_357 [Ralstonia phage RsoM2USA]